jgi:eukaryotic-like serine/threonine-protein kinase
MYCYTDLIFGPNRQLTSTSLPGEWATFRHDLNRTGSTDIGSSQPQGELSWSFQTGGEIHSSPAVVNGIIYFGSQDHNLYAIDAVTGEQRWVFQTGSAVESSPAVSNGVVYFGSNDGNFYALDAATGNKRWAYQTPYAVRSSPTVADGKVYFGADDYYLYCLDVKKGTRIWRFQAQGYVNSSPAVVNGIVYFNSMQGNCYALNASDGRFRLKYSSMSLLLSSPAVNNGELYFSGRGALYALDGKGRNWPWENYLRPLWTQLWAMGIAPRPPTISGAPRIMNLFSDPANTRSAKVNYADGTSVVTDVSIYTVGDNLVYCIDKAAFNVRWFFTTPLKIDSSPALANNVIYIGSDDGHLYAIDAQSGTKVWDFTTGGKIKSSPAFANGVVYFGSNDGKMYAVK